MTDYNKQAGSVRYNTYNVPGSPKTKVRIEGCSKVFFFHAPDRTWLTFEENKEEQPDLPADQLEALEAALTKHHGRRVEQYQKINGWNRHISELIENPDNVLETTTIYAGSFTPDGGEAPERGIDFEQSENGAAWLSYVVAHGPDRVKRVRRRLTDGNPRSTQSKKIWAALEEEFEQARKAQQQLTDDGREDS